MIYLNPNEQPIIEKLVQICEPYRGQIFTLKWQTGSYTAKFLCMIEDLTDELDDDDPAFEEYWSFWFEVLEVHGHPPVEPFHGSLLVNYHNFPEEILHAGVKVN